MKDIDEVPMQEFAFTELVRRISHIDAEAADYVKDNSCGSALKLLQCFIWSETPQGREYWEDIARKLGEIGTNTMYK